MDIKKILLGVTCFISALVLHAQNTPNSSTGPAAANAKRTPVYIPDASKDYVRSFVPQKPITDSSLVNMNQLIEDVLVSTQYFDELSRPFQTVTKQASPGKKDYVSPAAYDAYNRMPIIYMPYAANGGTDNDGKLKGNAFSADSTFYKGQFGSEQVYYGENVYDGSPMNRVLKQYAPGNSWGGSAKGVATNTRANTTADSVRLWTIAISTEDDVPASTTAYTAGSLMVEEVTDERGIKAIKYINQLGQTVLTKTQLAASPGTAHVGWLCTYYVYDEAGSLRYVIPPKATEALNANTWNFAAGPLTGMGFNLCYAYWYDNQGRVIMKRIPGKGKIYIAYDKMDRVVMTEDSSLRSTNQWTFVKYDPQSRPIKTGLITMTGLTKDQVITNAAASYDYPTLSGTYTIMSETYFDDYSFVSGSIPTGTLDNTNITGTNFITSYNTSPEYAQQPTQSNRIRGRVTGSKKLVLNSSPATWLYSVNIYDDHNRVIQSKQTNYTGGTDVATVQYSFSGRVLRSHLAHQFVSTTTLNHTLLTKYSYDHVGRLKTIVKNIDGKGDKTTLQNTYNELGQLSSKILGSSLETQNYSYNIRGWLLGINKTYTETAASTSNYFGEALFYDFGFTNTQINGNIAGAKWKGAGDGIQRAYGFGYDNSNRLTKADFTQQNDGSTSWTSDKMDFSVSGLSYDANGNILSMKQRGVTINTPATIDSLTYQYFANSNQLQKVTDGITDMGPWSDFKDTAIAADDYVYDVNGNIVKDNNKHIHTSVGGNGITYNFLDKATSITVNGKGTIAYTYDAGGALLQKISTNTKTGLKTVITYVAGFVYQKIMPAATTPSTVADTLQYALHEEGRIRWKFTSGATGVFVYDYFLKDHLGNVRSVITEENQQDYYPAATLEGTYSASPPDANSMVNYEKLFYAIDNNYITDEANIASWSSATGKDYFNHNGNPPANLNYPSGCTPTQTAAGTKLYKLNALTNKTGLQFMVKVMAGDTLDVFGKSYYLNTATLNDANSLPLDAATILGGLLIAPNSAAAIKGVTQTQLNNGNSGLIPASFIRGNNGETTTTPKAYINYIFFDEQFKFVSGGASRVGSSNTVKDHWNVDAVLQNIKVPKNGYVFVYVSNESKVDVFFDNLQVIHKRGHLLQESAYYPFGGTITAITSQAAAFGGGGNNYKFNSGTELNSDFDVDYYETYYRNYDPQVGRFTGIDLLAELTTDFTPYQYCANNPVYWNDPTGAALADPGLPPVTVIGYTHKNKSINPLVWNMILSDMGSGGGSDWIYGGNGGGGSEGTNSGGSGWGFYNASGGGDNGSDDSRRREGRDTRRRWRDENRERRTNLSLFDERGRELLGRWLDGSGKTLNTKNGVWGEYMKNDQLLNKQILDVLKKDASIRNESGKVNFQFHAEIENGYLTGYEMLHGTVTPLGDFQINGTAKFINSNQIQYSLSLTWNDVIDPNATYDTDTKLSKVLNFFYSPKDYEVHINWEDTFNIILITDE